MLGGFGADGAGKEQALLYAARPGWHVDARMGRALTTDWQYLENIYIKG